MTAPVRLARRWRHRRSRVPDDRRRRRRCAPRPTCGSSSWGRRAGSRRALLGERGDELELLDVLPDQRARRGRRHARSRARGAHTSRGALAGTTARAARRSLGGGLRSGPAGTRRLVFGVPVAILEPDQRARICRTAGSLRSRVAPTSRFRNRDQAPARHRHAPASRFGVRSGRALRAYLRAVSGAGPRRQPGRQGAQRRRCRALWPRSRGRCRGLSNPPSGWAAIAKRSAPQAYEQLGLTCAGRGDPIHRRRRRPSSAAPMC